MREGERESENERGRTRERLHRQTAIHIHFDRLHFLVGLPLHRCEIIFIITQILSQNYIPQFWNIEFMV